MVENINAPPRAVGICAVGVLRLARLALALAFGLVLSACIGPDMSEIGDYGSMLPFASASVPQKPHPVQVFIASTRKGESGAAAREQAPEAHFALATMTIPPGHRAGSVEAPLGPGQRQERRRARRRA